MEHEIGSTANIRELNQEVLLAVLRKYDCASIAELARQANLSVATCVKIINELLESGEVIEMEERAFGGGRPARRYRFNPNHALIAALILKEAMDEKKIIHFVADATGQVIASGATVVDALDSGSIDRLLTLLRRDHPAIKAISVSVPAMVSNGVVGTGDASLLTGIALDEHIKRRHNLIATVENDMNFAAMGYYKCKAYEGHPGLVYLLFPRGYCTGGGLVVNDRLVRGKSGFSGELSYMNFIASREDLRRILSNPRNEKRYWNYVAKTVIAATAMVNPGTIVLSGDDMREDMLPNLRDFCLAAIPPEHMPELVVHRDYSDDCLAGMIVLALSSLTRYPQLIDFALLAQAQ